MGVESQGQEDVGETKGDEERSVRCPGWRWPLALAFLFCALVLIIDAGVQPAKQGEHLSLRWARKAAEHPVRSALAVALCLWGLWPSSAQASGNPPTRTEISTRG